MVLMWTKQKNHLLTHWLSVWHNAFWYISVPLITYRYTQTSLWLQLLWWHGIEMARSSTHYQVRLAVWKKRIFSPKLPINLLLKVTAHIDEAASTDHIKRAIFVLNSFLRDHHLFQFMKDHTNTIAKLFEIGEKLQKVTGLFTSQLQEEL